MDPDRPDQQTGKWRAASLRQREVEYAQMSRGEIVDRAATVSSIASLPDAERERVLDRFRDRAATHPDIRGRETVTLPYLTRVDWTDRR